MGAGKIKIPPIRKLELRKHDKYNGDGIVCQAGHVYLASRMLTANMPSGLHSAFAFSVYIIIQHLYYSAFVVFSIRIKHFHSVFSFSICIQNLYSTIVFNICNQNAGS